MEESGYGVHCAQARGLALEVNHGGERLEAQCEGDARDATKERRENNFVSKTLGGANDGLVLSTLVFYSRRRSASLRSASEAARRMRAVSARFEGAVFALGKKPSGAMIGTPSLL